MTGRFTVNIPLGLKKEAEALAKKQGVSLNQFILWSVAEKVSALKSAWMILISQVSHTATTHLESQYQL